VKKEKGAQGSECRTEIFIPHHCCNSSRDVKGDGAENGDRRKDYSGN